MGYSRQAKGLRARGYLKIHGLCGTFISTAGVVHLIKVQTVELLEV